MKTKEKFNLSKEIGNLEVLPIEKVKEFIILIAEKVLLNWKGQGEFVDWLKQHSGDKLNGNK